MSRHCKNCITPFVYEGRTYAEAGTLCDMIEDTEIRRVYLCPKCHCGIVIVKEVKGSQGWQYQDFAPCEEREIDAPEENDCYPVTVSPKVHKLASEILEGALQ